MKRTCNGCRALSDYRGYICCDIGYKTAVKSTYNGLVVELKPLEECPKPKTVNELILHESLK